MVDTILILEFYGMRLALSRFVQIGYVSRKAAHNVRYQTPRALFNNPNVVFTIVKPTSVPRYLLSVLGPFLPFTAKNGI